MPARPWPCPTMLPNERGRYGPLCCKIGWSRSVLPAIDAAPEATPVKFDKPLLPHGKRRIKQGLLIELRERLLKPLHRQTFATLAQHLRNRSLNRRGLPRARAIRDANPRGGAVRALSGSDRRAPQ